MSDYSVLLNVAPMVLANVFEGGFESPCTGAAQDALISRRGFTNTLSYRPSQRQDGKAAVKSRPSVADVQAISCKVMKALQRLASHRGKFEKPTTHRLLELIFRTLPLVQLGSSICEHIFEKFHQVSKRELLLSNNGNPVAYSMQRWREVAVLSRAVATSLTYNIPCGWLVDGSGKELRNVGHHRSGVGSTAPIRRQGAWAVRSEVHGRFEEPRRALSAVVGGQPLRFWKTASHPSWRFKVRPDSTVGVPGSMTDARSAPRAEHTVSHLVRFFLVQSIATAGHSVIFVCRQWKDASGTEASTLNADQPMSVVLEEAERPTLSPAADAKQLALVLSCQTKQVLFSKESGFPFKSG